MLVSPRILVWFEDQRSLGMPKPQWHRVHLDVIQAVVWAAVLVSADFAAYFIYLKIVLGKTLLHQFE
jgi:hypothetical protein